MQKASNIYRKKLKNFLMLKASNVYSKKLKKFPDAEGIKYL
jgi:hypothetical protein